MTRTPVIVAVILGALLVAVCIMAASAAEAQTPFPPSAPASERYVRTVNPTLAQKVVQLDTGSTTVRQLPVTRVQSLLAQMAERYATNETAVADCAVTSRDLLRDKYGIDTKLQPLLEDLNRIDCQSRKPDDLSVMAVLYVQLRNRGKDGREAVEAVNADLAKSNRKEER